MIVAVVVLSLNASNKQMVFTNGYIPHVQRGYNSIFISPVGPVPDFNDILLVLIETSTV